MSSLPQEKKLRWWKAICERWKCKTGKHFDLRNDFAYLLESGKLTQLTKVGTVTVYSEHTFFCWQGMVGEGAEEEQGEVEMVALDIEEEEEEEAGSLSCYEALDWEENHNLTQSKGISRIILFSTHLLLIITQLKSCVYFLFSWEDTATSATSGCWSHLLLFSFSSIENIILEKPVKPKSYLYIVMQLCKKETLR